jgi:spore photoproduct lyase
MGGGYVRARAFIKKVITEVGEGGSDFSRQVLDRLPGATLHHPEDLRPAGGATDLAMEKRTLHLLSYEGRFLKPCPGTKAYICCGYQILNVGTNCPLDCSYCILQSYLNHPNLRVFVNLEEGLEEVFRRIDAHPHQVFRVGTGEFTDSLALDPITRWSDLLLPGFSKRKNAILELKTKTEEIGGLLSSPHRDRIVVSWSLNSPYMAIHEEHGAPSIQRRLKAARRCQQEGFTLGFHFDPLVPHSGWKEGYSRTLDLMDKYIDPRAILWISLGAFRFMPGLKFIIRKRHPESRVLDGEFVMGLDGKMRYFRPIRSDLYGFMGQMLGNWHRDLGVYLCMESDPVWQAALGWSPKDSSGLSLYLDDRVRKIFG